MQIVGYYYTDFSSTRHQRNLAYRVFGFKASIKSSQVWGSAIIAYCAMPDTGEITPFYHFQKDDVSHPLGASHQHIQP